MEGFIVLIEKEWIQFGHKFGERSGHTPNVSKSETSPVFLQWLDCVHQLLEQYPCSFEFNGSLLVFIMENVFSCKYGTFMANSVQEAIELKLSTSTSSLWSEILISQKSKFINALYAPNSSVLHFSCSSRTLRFWKEFFLRWDSQCSEREDAEGKLKYLLQEMERRQEKLKSMHDTLERQLSDRRIERGSILPGSFSPISSGSPNGSPSPHLRRRFSSMLALQNVKSTSNIELAMRELVENILENSFVAIQNRNNDYQNIYDLDKQQQTTVEIVQRPWIPEHWARACHSCNKKFTQLRRKVCIM